MKVVRVTRKIKEIKFEGVWDKLESKKKFPGVITHKIFETNSTFRVKSAPREKFIFCFSRVFR